MTTPFHLSCRTLCAAVALTLAAGAAIGAERYTKIANNGAVLPASAGLGSGSGDWACTRDNATGLLWEVKTDDGGLRDKDTTYTNYDDFYGTVTQVTAATNSIGFASAVNAGTLCAYADWRMPGKDELLGLVKTGVPPTIDSSYFPNTPVAYYWSGSSSVPFPTNAWAVNFNLGDTSAGNKAGGVNVRLVRGGQFIEHLVSLTGSGVGHIVADGIDCLREAGITYGICSNWAWKGSTVTLTATPLLGSSFTAWGGACSGSASTCTLTLTATTTVTAEFSAPPATRDIVINPATHATLHAAVEGQGIYTSTNSGGAWTAATTQPGNTNLRALVITSDGSKLYAATDGGGVFKSTDSGANWSACANTGLANLNLRALTLAGATLYVGTAAGVFTSSDACATWTAINTGLPN